MLLGADIPLVMRIVPSGMDHSFSPIGAVDRPATSSRRIRIPVAIIGPGGARVESGPVLVRESAPGE